MCVCGLVFDWLMVFSYHKMLLLYHIHAHSLTHTAMLYTIVHAKREKKIEMENYSKENTEIARHIYQFLMASYLLYSTGYILYVVHLSYYAMLCYAKPCLYLWLRLLSLAGFADLSI